MSSREAFQTLDAAIAGIVSEHMDAEMVTDFVVLVGTQWVDDDGDRCGRVMVFPRDGSQPFYITQGLLHAASQMMDQAARGGDS